MDMEVSEKNLIAHEDTPLEKDLLDFFLEFPLKTYFLNELQPEPCILFPKHSRLVGSMEVRYLKDWFLTEFLSRSKGDLSADTI